ncbi:uncharacterized protein RJT21DRAFT_119493 [Scheffersomyces amazonensis]|uniref:uncharacterized protein n=1 Tax=Scheffersomyces amazonensis TaxID=1078765 RepID=UPI00315D98CC
MKKPRLGKRALAALSRANDEYDGSNKEPTTAEDYLEQGSIDEESGDRWLGSDLSKSLRFYQKAYTSYIKSIHLSSGFENLDSYYNSSRLLFQVYYQYLKTDGVNLYDLTNVEDSLRQDDSSVIHNIGSIVLAHERAINIARQSSSPIPSDLLFNTATAYTEILDTEQDNSDSDFNQLLEVTYKAQIILSNLLDTQVNELRKFLDELKELDNNNVPQELSSSDHELEGQDEEKKSQEEYTAEEIVQPNDIFDTILASYKLGQSILENVTDFNNQVPRITDLITPLLTKSDSIAHDLINNFSDFATVKNDMVASLTIDQINEYKVIKTYIIGLTTSELDQLIQLWSESDLPETSERYMSTADNIQTFLDRNDINLTFVNGPQSNQDIKVSFWKALTQMNNNLKKAQDILNAQLSEKRKIPSGVDLGLGALIAQISEVMIARSDIDLQRCQIIDYEPAQQNQQVLLNNSKTMLKNAMNLANTPGGLRERIAEKMQREKKKVDSVLRLCVLEGKTSIQELDTILGRKKWINELPSLIKLGYFESFGILNIEQPTDF